RNIVVDLGMGVRPDGRRFSPIGALRANGLLDEIDLLVITHPHADHIADIDSLTGVKIHSLKTPAIPPLVAAATAMNAGPEFDAYTKLASCFDYPMPFDFAPKREF